MADNLLVSCHVAGKRWAEAVIVAERGRVNPQQRLWLGQELLRAEQRRDAAKILATTCGQVTGEDRTACDAMRQEASR
jgi:hypothetical protein